jgi:aryl-alcohol dehydrogenase-like predicted oxidoreductase
VLGGNVFGWTVKSEEAYSILDRFVDAGGTMIDTADVYSSWVPGNKGGESEAIIGEWLKRRGNSDGVLIASKVGMLPLDEPFNLSRGRIESAADASLKRLGVETIDLYYAHQDDPNTPQEESLAAFDSLVSKGKVRVLGASNFTGERLADALAISANEGFARYEVVQPEYHLMNRTRYEGSLQAVCLEEGISAVPYYGLASGFLTGKYRSTADFGQSVRGDRMAKFLTSKGLGVLGTLDSLAQETGATQAQIALAWVAAQPGVAAPIASARTLEQLEELIGAMELELTQEQLARLDAAAA